MQVLIHAFPTFHLCVNHSVDVTILLMYQGPEVDISLDDGDATIFKYVQRLVSQSASSGKAERFKRIWEPTYT